MKYIQVLFLFVCLFFQTLLIKAQQNHFIYIQTENKQPFYVKMNKKIYSSSASGYLIMAKLKPDVYDFSIGFPKNEWAEQNLQSTIVDKDLGYILKNYSKEGWGLLNLQTLALIMPINNKKNDQTAPVIMSDSFSNMLSSVVNDPTIKEEVKSEPKIIVAKKDSLIKISNNESSIIKKQINNSPQGLTMVYIDSVNGLNDTINILIPSVTETIVAKKDNLNKIKESIKINDQKPASQQVVTSEKDAKFLNIELPNPHTEVIANKNIDKSASSPMVNSDCKSFASEDDFLKLRKKMASANNSEVMITYAKKIFKTKCFNTEQVKNLSVLFLKDEGKYSFFDTAYPFVSDAQNFPSLQMQLSDDYFINRFKVMIRH